MVSPEWKPRVTKPQNKPPRWPKWQWQKTRVIMVGKLLSYMSEVQCLIKVVILGNEGNIQSRRTREQKSAFAEHFHVSGTLHSWSHLVFSTTSLPYFTNQDISQMDQEKLDSKVIPQELPVLPELHSVFVAVIFGLLPYSWTVYYLTKKRMIPWKIPLST